MGKNVSKSSLARANQDRDYHIFEEYAYNANKRLIYGIFRNSTDTARHMAKLAQTIIVMNHGKIEFMGTPREVFTSHADRLREIGLDVPQVLELATKLRNKGFDIRPDVLTVEEIKDEILKVMRGRKKC